MRRYRLITHLFRLFQEAGTNASANLRRMVASKKTSTSRPQLLGRMFVALAVEAPDKIEFLITS
jgi:hypothetical protein